jgi:phosphotriesterase-related protein
MTVNGPISPDEMGITLPHEHVLVDFIGAAEVSRDRYDGNEVFQTVVPYLAQCRELGGDSLVECTPAYLGRDPQILKRVSDAVGIHLLTNTGYYGARDGQLLPSHAFTESADQLAARWIREWDEGIDGTGIRPGFIKIGVNDGPLSGVDRKLAQAAARAHLETGLTIAAHTGPAVPAFEELDVLEQEGVDPSAWIWVHAHVESDTTRHVEAAGRGAWVEFDGLSPDQVERHVEFAVTMRDHGVLDRTLISQDAGWYHVGEPGGGTFRPYDTLFTEFVPALMTAGFTGAEVRQLLVMNPADAFAVRVRALTTEA